MWSSTMQQKLILQWKFQVELSFCAKWNCVVLFAFFIFKDILRFVLIWHSPFDFAFATQTWDTHCDCWLSLETETWKICCFPFWNSSFKVFPWKFWSSNLINKLMDILILQTVNFAFLYRRCVNPVIPDFKTTVGSYIRLPSWILWKILCGSCNYGNPFISKGDWSTTNFSLECQRNLLSRNPAKKRKHQPWKKYRRLHLSVDLLHKNMA